MNCNQKGEIALMKTMLDLVQKGYTVFSPVGEPKTVIDLLAVKDNKIFKIQVKYSISGELKYKMSRRMAKGLIYSQYEDNAFDYYAVYLPDIDTVVYPSIKFKGSYIASTPRLSGSFLWYKDFLNFTDNAPQRTAKELGFELHTKSYGVKRPKAHKIKRPTPEKLQKLLWEKSTVTIAKEFKVSDNCVAKWAKEYNLTKPPRGYWARKYAGKI